MTAYCRFSSTDCDGERLGPLAKFDRREQDRLGLDAGIRSVDQGLKGYFELGIEVIGMCTHDIEGLTLVVGGL